MSKIKDSYCHGLCHRCEWRAIALETGAAPRAECKQSNAAGSCYAYKPVIPCKLKPLKGDKRKPFAGMMMGARLAVIGLADGQYVATGNAKDGYSAYYVPEGKKKK